MALDLQILGDKLRRYREQFQLSLIEVSDATGISQERIITYEEGNRPPSGDELLILADFYRCDYKFFISNERLAPFEQTETLFRRFGDQFSKQDRWAVQEFLFLAECECFLQGALNKMFTKGFTFRKRGNYFRKHAEEAAAALRDFLGYSERKVPLNIYEDFRSIGIHIFRRKLENSNISGLFVHHPVAGPCALVNYNEDIYRQRFTAAHEAGHAILDADEDFVVSFTKDQQRLQETRANTFAARYLMPPKFINSISERTQWGPHEAIEWANKLKVSTQALANVLTDYGHIDRQMREVICSVKVPRRAKSDPELPSNLSPRSRTRKQELLERGLSSYYVNLCFEGYREGIISASRLAEMLLIGSDSELRELAKLYGESLQYGT